METNTKNRSFRIVVAGIIVKNNSVLLLQRHENEAILPGLWELPSGRRKFGENSIEALMREVREETGLLTTVGSPVSVFEYLIEKETEIRDTTQINFLAYPEEPNREPTVSKEHQLAKWFFREEIESLQNVSTEVKSILLSVLT